MTTTETRIDEATLQAMVETAVGHMAGAAVTAGIALGERLGLYRTMAAASDAGITSDDLADRTGTHRRLVREWLDGQTAAGFLSYDPATDRYILSTEAAMVLAVEDSPVFIAGGVELFGVNFRDMDRMESAMRSDGELPWSEHHASLSANTGRFFRPGYLNQLTTHWIPALDGISDRLEKGGSVADVGCGVGYTSALIAGAYPQSTVLGVDTHLDSLDMARDNAREAGVDDRTTFVQADAAGYHGSHDLIAFFDCLHDLGDPLGAARHARDHLFDGGAVMVVEPFAFDDRAANHASPDSAISYHQSLFLCLPNSLSQPGSRALGAQAGEDAIREVFQQAGFPRFRRVAETPVNLVYEAKL